MNARISRREFLTVSAASVVHSACSQDATDSDANTGPLHYATLLEIARMIESKDLSPVALTQMMLDRIESVDARLKSYATVMADQAMAAARRAEDEIQAGKYRGPLHGVPIAVKDLCYTKGVRTMGGLKILADFVPQHDATVVAKLKEAGAVMLGKLNMTEGATGGYHPDFDIPVNPWGEDLWAGVSSSGSGVATAAGLCFASLGSDTGGSIRMPSAANGIVGLKPTYGRVSRYGVLPLAESLDHVGPMTRSVGDAAVVFEAIAGLDENDPTSLPDPVPNMLEALRGGVEGLRIGFDRQYIGRNGSDLGDPGLVPSIEAALELLEGLGARTVELTLPDFPDVMYTLVTSEAYEAHKANYPSRTDEYGPYFGDFLAHGAAVSPADYAAATQTRAAYTSSLLDVLSSVDAVAVPAGRASFSVSKELQYGRMEPLDEVLQFPLPFNSLANLSGAPTVTLPCGFSEDGLPYTIQFLGKGLSEPLLCRIGHTYEAATEWHKRHPVA